MFHWKDFFYYSKNERIGILLLLVLICVAGIFYVLLHRFIPLDPSYVAQTEVVKKEIETFESNLISVPTITDNHAYEEDIPAKKTPRTKPEKLKEGQTLDLNAVSAQTLTRIPGIGDTFAERIIEYRNNLGGFIRLDQLREIKGITMNKYSKILPYVVLKRPHRTFDINRVSLSHPYLNEQQVEAIKTIRLSNKIESVEDLAQSEHFTANDLDRLKPYIRFR